MITKNEIKLNWSEYQKQKTPLKVRLSLFTTLLFRQGLTRDIFEFLLKKTSSLIQKETIDQALKIASFAESFFSTPGKVYTEKCEMCPVTFCLSSLISYWLLRVCKNLGLKLYFPQEQ